MKIRILIVDDHEMVRELLHHILKVQTEWVIVGETGNGLHIIPLIETVAPHVVCMDINLPGMNGIEVTRSIRTQWPNVKVVALSAYADRHHVLDMLHAGASAYVTKAEASTEVINAIQSALDGRIYLCPDASEVVTSELLSRDIEARSSIVLGERERQVLKQVAAGQTSIEIAKLMLIAVSTVEVHRRNIMRKLGLHSVAELTRYVVNNERSGY